MNKQILTALVVGAAMASASNTASAAIDVSAIVTEINGVVAPVGLIGVAVLTLIVAIKAYKWVRRAF